MVRNIVGTLVEAGKPTPPRKPAALEELAT
jgi:hypothetical protein